MLTEKAGQYHIKQTTVDIIRKCCTDFFNTCWEQHSIKLQLKFRLLFYNGAVIFDPLSYKAFSNTNINLCLPSAQTGGQIFPDF